MSILETLSDLTNISSNKLVQIFFFTIIIVSVTEVFIGIICAGLGYTNGMADDHLNYVLRIVGPACLTLGIIQIIIGFIVIHIPRIKKMFSDLQGVQTRPNNYQPVHQDEDAELLNSRENTASSDDELSATQWKPSFRLNHEVERGTEAVLDPNQSKTVHVSANNENSIRERDDTNEDDSSPLIQ